ncbi:MAG TPA: flagellar protein export ATPase FliI [Rhodospirillaceae bacterium]|nr:flagellum-specific ATP synthase FliI [Rhodospirillaceae bacterium]HAA92492.1 flagellar protein export ATPase FliI [Rhodospirillaceae bacterium]HAT35234.1 flagellar protein export ATPase FliI [Rhodospirillaceae bacterium]
MNDILEHVIDGVSRLDELKLYGRVKAIQGMLIEIEGLGERLSVGERCHLEVRDKPAVACEIVGFRDNRALAMPFGPLEGVGLGCRALVGESQPVAYPDERWLGRVINAFGEPLDGGAPIVKGQAAYPLRASPPPAHQRQRVAGKIDLGVRAINTFITCCRGQRMGIFSGSGVGKSILMSMLSRYSTADVIVIGLIGERGREVKEFIEEDLGEEGLARSVLVVATSNESALMRRQAAYMTMAVAEYFRDQGRDVLCLMDSITRFAMAQREIGLSAGEPPASKGYTPTVFAEMPKLLERAGPGTGMGSITGLFTVLVEGDDHNEPISDAVRGIVDGHIVLDRAIAERNRYPAINILRSVSRTLPACNSEIENQIIDRARSLMAVYEDMAELIRLGAYRQGSDPAVDEAIRYYQGMEDFLQQGKLDQSFLEDGYRQLAEILEMSVQETPTEPEAPVGEEPTDAAMIIPGPDLTQATAQASPAEPPAPVAENDSVDVDEEITEPEEVPVVPADPEDQVTISSQPEAGASEEPAT